MWKYKEKEIHTLEDMPDNAFGFIYQILHIPSGKKYIGKKQLYFNRKKKFSKKEISLVKDRRLKLYEVITSESDWKTYYGSQKEIKQLVKQSSPNDFIRTILCFVPTSKLLTYYECKYLFSEQVLEKPEEFINDNILGKFFKKDFI